MKKKLRLDELLIQNGYAENKKKAQSLILSGSVLVNEKPETRVGALVSLDSNIRIRDKIKNYVSRGAYKLLGAMEAFSIHSLSSEVCVDIGASTGGFTQVLLEKGANLVLAIDVGKGQLATRLRKDPRVYCLDTFHFQNLSWNEIESAIHERGIQGFQEKKSLFVTADVSFISIERVFTIIQKLHEEKPWIHIHGNLLIKPQFEVGEPKILEKGVIKDPLVRWKILLRIVRNFRKNTNGKILGLVESCIPGAKGNKEYFMYFSFAPKNSNDL